MNSFRRPRYAQILWSAIRQSREDQIAIWAAALAFYAMLSLGPLLFIAIGLAGVVVGRERAAGLLLHQIGSIVGPDAARMIRDVVAKAELPDAGFASTAIATVTLVLGASGVFSALQDAINAVFHVRPSSDAGLLVTAKRKILSISMTLSLGFLLMVSVGLTSLFALFAVALPSHVLIVGALLEFFCSLALNAGLVSAIFYLLPDARVARSHAGIGGGLTALALTVGRLLIGFYMGQTNIARPFGAAASLAGLLVWMYYAAQILLFGAEFTRAYASRLGDEIEPAEDAVQVEVVEQPS